MYATSNCIRKPNIPCAAVLLAAKFLERVGPLLLAATAMILATSRRFLRRNVARQRGASQTSTGVIGRAVLCEMRSMFPRAWQHLAAQLRLRLADGAGCSLHGLRNQVVRDVFEVRRDLDLLDRGMVLCWLRIFSQQYGLRTHAAARVAPGQKPAMHPALLRAPRSSSPPSASASSPAPS